MQKQPQVRYRPPFAQPQIQNKDWFMAFNSTVDAGIAEVIFNKPPVNAFNSAEWAGIAAEIKLYFGGNACPFGAVKRIYWRFIEDDLCNTCVNCRVESHKPVLILNLWWSKPWSVSNLRLFLHPTRCLPPSPQPSVSRQSARRPAPRAKYRLPDSLSPWLLESSWVN